MCHFRPDKAHRCTHTQGFVTSSVGRDPRVRFSNSGIYLFDHLCSVGKTVSYVNPQLNHYNLSSSLSALCHLTVLSLVQIFPADALNAKEFESLRLFFGISIKDSFAHIQPASLSSLTKYWSDPSEDIQISARAIFPMVLENMRDSMLDGFVKFWLNLRTCSILSLSLTPHV